MDKHEAKEVLALFRPDTDEISSNVSEALEVVRQDTELATWYEHYCELENAISASINSIPVPDDLRERICSNRPPMGRVIRWSPPHVLARAAAVILIVGAGVWLLAARQDRGFDGYRQRMVSLVADDYQLTVEVDSLEAIRQAFAAKAWPSDYTVPDGLKSVEVEGGNALRWRGRKVSMLCLETEDDKYLWLFVAETSDVRDPPEAAPLEIMQVDRLMTAAWSDDDYVYLLAVEGDRAFLSEHL